MFKLFSLVGSLWRAIKWVRQQRTEMEKDVNGYLSEKRAKQWRLNAEKFFTALEKGKGASAFPSAMQSVCKWVFSRTEAENRIGYFGQALLKSEKMDGMAEQLQEPIE